MSLFSILTGGSAQTTSFFGPALPASAVRAQAQLAEQLSAAAAKGVSGPATSGADITMAAKRAAAAAADARKDAAALAKEIRNTLDGAVAGNGTAKGDFSALSNRALATVALNRHGAFTRAEIHGAKAELAIRDRQDLLERLSSDGLSASTLAAYQSSRLTARASMSAEEIQLRDSGALG